MNGSGVVTAKVTLLPPSTPVPSFDTKLPKSMTLLLHTWNDRTLESYRGRNQRDWPSNIAQAYNKYLYLYDYIKARAERMGTTEAAAAADCDKERKEKKLGGRSVYKYYEWIKIQDTSIKRRRKRSGVGTTTAERENESSSNDSRFDSDDDEPLAHIVMNQQQAGTNVTSSRPSVHHQRPMLTQARFYQQSLRDMYMQSQLQRHLSRHPPAQLPRQIGPPVPMGRFNLQSTTTKEDTRF